MLGRCHLQGDLHLSGFKMILDEVLAKKIQKQFCTLFITNVVTIQNINVIKRRASEALSELDVLTETGYCSTRNWGGGGGHTHQKLLTLD